MLTSVFRSPVVWALLLSLGLHVAAIVGWEVLQVAVRAFPQLFPAWVQQVVQPRPETDLAAQKPPEAYRPAPDEVEIPLSFIEVDPSLATEEAPKESRMPRRTAFALALLLVGIGSGVSAQPQSDTIRIGVFDPETLWKLTEVGKKYNSELTEARDRLQAEIDRKSQELEDLKDKLRQQQASLSEDKIQQMQKEILNKRTELDRMNEDATKEMKFQLNDVQNRFQQMLEETVETYGKEKNLALILNKSVIDYNAPQVDITQDLIARFNVMHKAPPPSTAKAPARKATATPAYAKLRRNDSGNTSSAQSDAATVRALKATVRPAVRTVRCTATAGS